MKLVLDIFTYGFRGHGKFILIIGAVLSLLAELASFAPFIGILAMFLFTGFFCAMYFDIIETTAGGSEEAPGFPDIMSVVGDILVPFLKIGLVILVSFTPWLTYVIFWEPFVSEDEFVVTNPAAFYGLLAFGILYFPMALLAVVIMGTLTVLSPHVIIPAIFRGGFIYLLAIFIMIVMLVFQAIISDLLIEWPLIQSLVMAVVGIYSFMTHGRALGIVYREREEQLGWL